MNYKNLLALLPVIALPAVALASSADDRKIEQAAQASYNFRTVLDENVKVKASDGIVTLSGAVQDKDDKALAEDTVENLPGVTRVKNDITVSGKVVEHSDAWIALKVRSRLLVKNNVSATMTKVAAHDGVVTLSGTAENIAQKELTAIYAHEIEGVKSVQNDLVVKSHSGTATETVGEKIDDASITSQLKFALLHHTSTHALKTKVVTTDGKVVVTGEASSDAEKSLVTKLAGDVRGVKSVTNGMSVKS